MRVTKEVTFDAAHMLSKYNGKCNNLHGHTYKLQVSIDADMQTEGNERGMVMDFNTLKQLMDGIVESFDHAIIFSGCNYRSEAEDALLDWANNYGKAYIILEGRSTSENIARQIRAYMVQSLDSLTMDMVHVRLWETPTSFAEV